MNTEKGYFTRQEILSQPEAWAAALKVLAGQRRAVLDFALRGGSGRQHPGPVEGSGVSRTEDKKPFQQVILTGCGSTYYLALAAAALTQELTGCPARAFPASELWLSPRSCYVNGKTLLVAVSRSGETTETLRACEAFLTDQHGELVTLSCYGETPLAKMGKLNLVLPSGQEKSVAQTRAFSILYLGTVALACLWGGRVDLFDSLTRLPEIGQRILKNSAPLAAELGRDPTLDRFYWLGSGLRYGLACELSLKMKEMSLSHSEPFHFLEFRHGPKSMVTLSTLTVGLRSSVNGPQEAAVLEDIKGLGGRILDIAETDAQVRFESGLAEAVRNVLYLPLGQLIAFERSLSKGLNPDQPNNLDSVVKLS